MNVPNLPAHYHQPGKTDWQAAPYCTNAIDAEDRPGNRQPLPVDITEETALTDHGSFRTFEWRGGGVWRVWLYRPSLDTALFYREGNGSARKALGRAVEAQTAIEAAHGRVVLSAPVTTKWSKQK